ncbi:TELO2-interacting protein 2 isoform 2-T2 [Anomaloglossus baeobatrachus]|uniref:TELO2-interacting protein 2 isoform X2 n=1 Tax=Anomaloglossus baeobatrachus TaxID=238106 RepID=UPI003F4F5879
MAAGRATRSNYGRQLASAERRVPAGVGMAAAELPLARAFSAICVCLGRAPVVPRSPAGCTELLQALIFWAAPAPENERDSKEVPVRAAAALRASLLLLEAVASSRGDHVSTAEAEKKTKPEKAEDSGKCGGSRLLQDAGAPISPEWPLDGLMLRVTGQGAGASSEEEHVAPEPPHINGGAPTLPEKTDDASTTSDGAPKSMVDNEPIIEPQCVQRCAAAPLLLLCGTYIYEVPWSDAECRRLASELLSALLELSHCATVSALLEGDPALLKGGLEQPFTTYREALRLLGPRLRKDTWETYPESKVLFAWLLMRVPRPWLSEFLSRVMPPSLLFSDDYKQENKVLGIRCLQHIIKNVPAAELRQYNRALVVYHALRNHLYSTDAQVIEVVLDCLLDIFPVLHKPPPAVGAYHKDGENPPDQVMQIVLTNMEMEHRIVLRRLYAQKLLLLLKSLQVGIIRHMKRLLRVIVGYLEVADGTEESARISMLENLKLTIKFAWPRIPPRLPLLVKALIKLMYEVSVESYPNSVSVTSALAHGSMECLLFLDYCTKGQVKAAVQDIPSVCDEPILLKCISPLLKRK